MLPQGPEQALGSGPTEGHPPPTVPLPRRHNHGCTSSRVPELAEHGSHPAPRQMSQLRTHGWQAEPGLWGSHRLDAWGQEKEGPEGGQHGIGSPLGPAGPSTLTIRPALTLPGARSSAFHLPRGLSDHDGPITHSGGLTEQGSRPGR